MNKQGILAKLDKSWTSFKESFNGLNDKQMLEPGVVAGWSVKDILAHVSIWEEEALKYLPFAIEGRRPPRYKDLYGGIDAFNAQMVEKKRTFTLAEVLTQLDETHNRLVSYITAAPDTEFSKETRFRRRLRLDTFSHYPLHEGAIREWRQRSGYNSANE